MRFYKIITESMDDLKNRVFYSVLKSETISRELENLECWNKSQ